MSWKTRVHAIASQVTRLTTHMANWIVGALAHKMSGLFTIPTHSCRVAFSSNVARKSTVVAYGHIWTISSKMPRSFTFIAQIILSENLTDNLKIPKRELPVESERRARMRVTMVCLDCFTENFRLYVRTWTWHGNEWNRSSGAREEQNPIGF